MSISIIQDLRSDFGPIRDQLDRPTCAGFAASACHEVRRRASAPFSVEDLHHAAHVANGDTPHPKVGVTWGGLVTALRDAGQGPESYWPYSSARKLAGSVYAPPSKSVDRQRCLLSGPLKDAGAVFDRLLAGHPVLLVMKVCAAFHSAKEQAVRDVSGAPRAMHAVVGVGVATDGERLAIVRNSWGESWGASGYGIVAERYLVARMKWAAAVERLDP